MSARKVDAAALEAAARKIIDHLEATYQGHLSGCAAATDGTSDWPDPTRKACDCGVSDLAVALGLCAYTADECAMVRERMAVKDDEIPACAVHGTHPEEIAVPLASALAWRLFDPCREDTAEGHSDCAERNDRYRCSCDCHTTDAPDAHLEAAHDERESAE